MTRTNNETTKLMTLHPATAQSSMKPLDLGRMLLGDEPPLFLVEIAIRTAVLFIYTLVVLRLLGKRGVAQMSLFEVTIVIGLGAAVGDPMFQADVPLVHGMIVIAIIVILYRTFLALVRTNEGFERFVEGEPSCLVSEGRIQLPALARERISQEELFEILRLSGVMQLGEVKRAFLEQSGGMSVFAYAPKHVKPGLPLMPPWDIALPPTIEVGKTAPVGEYACMTCGEVRSHAAHRELRPCPRCKGTTFTRAVSTPASAEAVTTQ